MHEQVGDELRRPGQHRPVRRDDHRVALEDQLVLTTDHVDVRDGGAGLGGPPAHHRKPQVVLVQLVRRAVDVDHQPDPGPPGGGERPPGLPQVLADGQCHVHPAQPDHGEHVAGHEVAVLVEDAVVGQMVLEVGGDHLAAMQQRGGVARSPARLGFRADLRRPVSVQVAHHDRQVTEAVGGQIGGEPGECRLGGGHEGPPEDQILHRVTGQHHLREQDQLGTGGGGPAGPGADETGVAGEVTDTGVDLAQGETQGGHVLILPQRHGLDTSAWGSTTGPDRRSGRDGTQRPPFG